MRRSFSFTLLALLGFAALPHAASAQLIGTTVTGTLTGSISPSIVAAPNRFDPANGNVPAGYGNSVSPNNVLVTEPLTEFGFNDGLNFITVNVTDTQVILNDSTTYGTTGYTITLNDTGFTQLTKVSDNFGGITATATVPGTGVTASRNGSLITLTVPTVYTVKSLNAQANFTAVFNVAAPAAVPEPGSVALLVGMGSMGAGFLVRRRKSARKAA